MAGEHRNHLDQPPLNNNEHLLSQCSLVFDQCEIIFKANQDLMVELGTGWSRLRNPAILNYIDEAGTREEVGFSFRKITEKEDVSFTIERLRWLTTPQRKLRETTSFMVVHSGGKHRPLSDIWQATYTQAYVDEKTQETFEIHTSTTPASEAEIPDPQEREMMRFDEYHLRELFHVVEQLQYALRQQRP